MIIFSGKTHISFYIFCVMLLFQKDCFSPSDWQLVFFLGGLVGCLFPDIDQHIAIAGHAIPLHKLFDAIQKVLSSHWKKLKVLNHGGITHTIICNALIVIIPCIVQRGDILVYLEGIRGAFWLGLAFGFYTHLLGDDFDGDKLKHLYLPFGNHVPLLVLTPIIYFLYLFGGFIVKTID